MRSVIDCFTTATVSCYKDPHSERKRSSKPNGLPASLRSVHDDRSGCSRWSDPGVHYE
jgi:hypothetical protein